MNKAAVYGKDFDTDFYPVMELFIKHLTEAGIEIWIYGELYRFLKENLPDLIGVLRVFEDRDHIPEPLDYFFSIGGDGTFLEAAALTRGLNIPLVGINSGRLGFLANISKKNVSGSMAKIIKKKYTVEERSLIEVRSDDRHVVDFALNDVAIQKESSKLLTIHSYLNGELLNSYWADGLIIATPTGSTAYSLSVGGPIVVPGSENFIISPISPHMLAVRPVVIPDHHEIKLKIEARDEHFILSVDYRSYRLASGVELEIKKADDVVKMLKLQDDSYYRTIREKLMWGRDKRN